MCSALSKPIQAMLDVMRVFLAPLKADALTRKRIEAAILSELKSAPKANRFQLDGIKHAIRREGDRCTVVTPLRIVGMPDWLWI